MDSTENCRKYALKSFWSACTWLELGDLTFCVLWTKLLVRSQNGLMLVTSVQRVWSRTSVTHVNSWTIQIRIVSRFWFCRRLWALGSTSDGLSCISEAKHFCQKVGCERNRHQSQKQVFLDASLRMDGIPALDLWDLVIHEFHSSPNPAHKTKDLAESGKLVVKHNTPYCVAIFQPSTLISIWLTLITFHQTWHLLVPMLVTRLWGQGSRDWDGNQGQESNNETCVKNPHSCFDWLFGRINLDPKIQIKYIDTKNQLADILTKGYFTHDEWNHLLCLFNTGHFSSTNCLEVMSRRTQEDAGEERATAKSKPMMNFVSRYSVRDPNVLASTASERLVKT